MDSVDAGNVQNTRASGDNLASSPTGQGKMIGRKYLLSSKPGWASQSVSTWENEGGSRRNLGFV
jgi:hypothetical protein